MALNLSTYLANKLLDHSLGTASYTMPTGVWIALYTDDPTPADAGTEVSGGSYARIAVTFDAAAAQATQNAAQLTSVKATGDWGVISHIGLRDAAAAGNLLWHGALTASKPVSTGDYFRIEDGDLDVALA